jgi:SAM-dependent methyltransferase
VHDKLLEILAEPSTGAALKLRNAQRGEGHAPGHIESGELVSESTGKVYPIVRGIPRFVEGQVYAESFGFQWNRFQHTQVDSVTGASHSTRRFDEEAGWPIDQLRGRLVLDAGCGAGRFSEVVARREANLVALDYSSAVEAAAKTLEPFPNVNVVQGNLLEPPFRQASFDFAYCIGVVQHTPDPNQVVQNVISRVKPGGRFSFSIYARQPWTKLNAKYLVRPLTKRLPPDVLLRGIRLAMPVVFPITDVLFELPIVGKFARFAIPVASYDRGDFSREQRYEEAVLDTFDMLSP